MAFAARTLKTPVFEVSVHQDNPSKPLNPGPRAANCTAHVRLTNISGVPQTVKVRLRDITFDFGMPVKNQSGLTGWASNDGLWVHMSRNWSDFEWKTLSIGADASAEAGFFVGHRAMADGNDGIAVDTSLATPWNTLNVATSGDCATATEPNTICGMAAGMKFRVEVRVEEDRGAVLSNLVATCYLYNSTDPIETKINQPMNGARPF